MNVAQVRDLETETTARDPDPLELGIAYTALLFMGAGNSASIEASDCDELDRFSIRRRAEALASADTRTLKRALYDEMRITLRGGSWSLRGGAGALP